jgi:aldehyde oxidoreductase
MIGESHPAPALIKACGVAEFSADFHMQDSLEISVAHAMAHHASIKSVDTSIAEKMPVWSAHNREGYQGTNRIRAVSTGPALLCEMWSGPMATLVCYCGCRNKGEQARAAAAAVRIELEPLPLALTSREAIAPGAYQSPQHTSNLIQTYPLIKGDVDKALAESLM